MFGNKKNETDNTQEQFDSAKRRRDELQAKLPELQSAVGRAAAKTQAAKDAVERAHGDFLIGEIDEGALKVQQAHLEDALNVQRTADAELRKAQADIKHLNDAISRLGPKVNEACIAQHHEALKEVILELLPLMAQVETKMRKARAVYLEAEAKMPFYYEGMRRNPRPWPVAAGLVDLSWSHFTREPGTGGLLEGWRVRVEEFLNPQPPAPPQKKSQPFDPPRTSFREPGARWVAAPEERR